MAFRRLFSRSQTTTTTPTGPSFSDVFDDVFFGPGGLFPMSQEWKTDPHPKLPRPPANSKHGSIPIHVDDAENKREAKGQRRRADPLVASMAKAAAAAVRLQAAARGFLARRSLQAVREVERKAETVEYVVRQREEELRGNQSARVAVAEALMGMLLRLDAVRGAREYRRRVARKVLALQDAIDALEPKAPAGVATAEGEIGEENAAGEAKPASDDANRGDDKPDCSDADAEWEILKEEKKPTAPPRHDLAGQGIAEAADAGAGAVDTGKLMEMVAALWERNAEQSAMIGALECTVRRMEDAERRA
ncbi:unnamed protein product [Urochloa decumbens]|uniref:BAG domain-containing protein n=1 Tax=Urochloa decumbens TaxID=240449 RepID=A0ABC9E5I8_9POAL